MRTISLICSLLFSTIAFTQNKQSFKLLIDSINNNLLQYSKLSPFDQGYHAIAEFGLSKDEIDSLLVDANYDETINSSRDSIQAYHMIYYYQERIINQMQRLMKRPDLDKYDLNSLLNAEGDLLIIISDDRKLYNYSLDEKTGGTYRSRISFMHYTGFNTDSLRNETGKESLMHFSPSDGLSEIITLDSEEGTKYLLFGQVRGCSYCFESHVTLVSLKEGVFQEDFSYSVNSRSWEGGINYNQETKTITVDYITDDLTTSCNCSNQSKSSEEQEDYFSTSNEGDSTAQQCNCSFKFNGVNFELVKVSWEKLK